ncbi:MAG: phosphodiester glycosidase family protein [Rikenellaceae bacterium]|nr:phosphodiester glycosidase family protein [Rikenellaceae bacterium]
MKRIFIFTLFAVLLSAVHAQASSRKEKTPNDGMNGWRVRQIDGDKLVWYSFRGEKGGAQQFVNVLALDLNCKDYELDFVVLDKGDSLSSVALRHDAVAGINATYEWDASFVKADGEIFSEITLSEEHLRFWKHEGAIAYDGRKIDIGYGDKASYLKSRMPNIFSASPMLIDNYKPVGATFVGDITDVELTKLEYEDYRRHQGVRHPRTAVALTRSNRLLLITIDGRSTNSAGMSAKEVTEFLVEYFNPRLALNMDGGGSTTMYIKGSGESSTDVVNYPTDNSRYDHYGQRRVSTHILIKRKR